MATYTNQRNLPVAPPAATGDMQLTSSNIFNSKTAFELAFQMANTFAHSTIVPREYQNNAANCLIALNMATRNGMDPMMVMQNLFVIQGRPSWSSQFIIAMINKSGKYKTELQYDLNGKGDDMECSAYAYDHMDRKVSGPTITMHMARAEGWLEKNGSKWKTMPEMMIRYRAASFFGRLNCPELIMGIYSEDEVIEISASDYKVARSQDAAVSSSAPSTAGNAYDGAMEVGELPSPDMPSGTSPTRQAPPDTPKTTEHTAVHAEQIGGNGNADRYAVDSAPTVSRDMAGSVNATGGMGDTAINSGEFAPLTCADCGAAITKAVQGYSIGKFGRPLCRNCQNAAKGA